MRILAIGDVCGSIGCRYLQSVLPKIKREKNIDAVIVNGENSADGNGITPESAAMLFNCGADIITGGNHTLRRKEVYDYLDENEFVLRPHNLPNASFGRGYGIVDFGFTRFAVINLSGKIYFEDKTIENPFTVADELIERAKADGIKIILVDFHAEATSEKRALGLYLDGKASAVFGTHTHVQTADEQILFKMIVDKTNQFHWYPSFCENERGIGLPPTGELWKNARFSGGSRPINCLREIT